MSNGKCRCCDRLVPLMGGGFCADCGEVKMCSRCGIEQHGVKDGVCWSCNRIGGENKPEWSGIMNGIVWVKCGCGEEVPAAKMVAGQCAWCRAPKKPRVESIDDLDSDEKTYSDRMMESAGE